MGGNKSQTLAYDFSIREIDDRKLEVDVMVPFNDTTRKITYGQADAFFGEFDGLTFADKKSRSAFCDAVFNGILDITVKWPKDGYVSELRM